MEKLFKFQDWPVYKATERLNLLVSEIHTSKTTKTGRFDLIDQLKRASSSIILNLAEGYGRATKKDKLSFLRIALGSTYECVAIIDILKSIGILRETLYQKTHRELYEIAKML
jgi:four helix bundle protein